MARMRIQRGQLRTNSCSYTIWLNVHALTASLRFDRSLSMVSWRFSSYKQSTTMRHSLINLYYTPPNSPYYSANRQCLKFVMKPRVPSFIIALCSSPSIATPIGDDQYYPPQLAQNRASQPEGQSHFVDGSWPIFSMYLEMVEEGDEKMAKSWKADADDTLVFVRLSSSPILSTDPSVRLVYSPLL